jgi:glycosyltransferase involved in cell wall biosynthesis
LQIALIDPSLFTLPYDAALASGLAACGHRPTLYARKPRAFEGDVSDIAFHESFYRFSECRLVAGLPRAVRLAVKGADHLSGMAGLLRLLKQRRPDAIHFQWLPLPVIDARMLGGFASIAPTVLTVHDTDPFNGSPSARLQKLGIAGAVGRFSRIIVHTRQGFARLTEQGIEPRRIAVIPHGPLAPLHDGGTDMMDGPLTLTLFGKIKPYKGADILLAAYAALPEALRLSARVRIVGQAYMDLAPLHALAASLGIAGHVSIEDRFVAESELGAVFSPGTIAVFPYREIEASGVLSLAAAFGRPIIASRLGNFAETLTDGTHGRLVKPGDVVDLSEAMSAMIANRRFTAECASSVAALARDATGWADIAAKTVRVYEAAAGDEPHRSNRLALARGHAA